MGNENESLSLIDHLKELRTRTIRCCISIILCFLPLIYYSNTIYQFVSSPLQALLPGQSSMIATEVASPFFAPIKLTFFVSLLISIPYILYQVWGFISPAMYKNEKRFAYTILFSSIALFYIGIMFSYLLVFPLIFNFFTSVAPEGILIMTDINSYLDFVLKMFIAFSFSFEIPIIILMLTWAGITTRETLATKRPYIVLACFIMAMILTPPDVISQILLAVPAYLLFELGLVLSWLFDKKKERT